MRQGIALQQPLALLQLKRRMELDADRLASAKMAEAGYDPAALARYIEREQPSSDEASHSAFAPLPRRAQRVEAIREVIAGLPAREYGPHEGLAIIQEAVRRSVGSAQ
jgi:predicted Zn-dependent protease